MARKPKIPKANVQFNKWIKDYSLDEFMRLNREQRASVVADLQEKFMERAEELREGETKYTKSRSLWGIIRENSPADEDIFDVLVNTKKASANKLAAQFLRLQEFFNAKTSTVEGMRRVSREEDIRIFGPSEKNPNIPAHRLSTEQRTLYWSLYNEFQIMHPVLMESVGSGEIQKVLGEMFVGKRRKIVDKADFLERLRKLLSGDDSNESVRNVQRGRSEE